MSNRHYSKAPIIEAIVDIQVALSPDSGDASITMLADKLKDTFPIRTKITTVQMRVDGLNQDESAPQFSSSHEELGLKLADKKNSRILQLRRVGFTYSHLPPYSDWDHFSIEAKDYWKLFINICRPEMVTRCAVRYINRIDIPTTPVELEDYLNIYPKIPGNISQLIYGMHMQLQMPQDDIESMAVINEAVVSPAISGGLSVIVDIDLFRTLKVSPDSDEVWENLERLRIRKNQLFEAFITDNTRELIQ